MKYFIKEGKPDGEFNASNKAREDVEKILDSIGIKKEFVCSKNGIQKNKMMKWKQFLIYKNNIKAWKKTFSKFKKGDIVFIQYPILNTTIGLEKLFNELRRNGIIIVAIIHDLDSLRFKPGVQSNLLCKRVSKEDKEILNEMNYIICHNSSMKKELIKLGNNKDNIIELQLFDYLLDKEPKKIERKVIDPVIIAGNLSPEKAKYLSFLNTLNNNFNLFGVGYNESMSGKNIFYKGKFKPEELLDYLEGSFGLVWDGESLDTCKGGFGEYLKYNNPHKVSLYLTAGIPVIIWKESALADFVKKNNVGILINSLKDINKEIKNISKDDYKKMLDNVKKISNKTKNGMFLKDAIKKIKEME